jgi:hypothetical protein
MFTRRSAKSAFASSVVALAAAFVPVSVQAGYAPAIAAGVAGGVVGTMAGEALSGAGALPPQTNYPPQQPQCHYEHLQEFRPYSFHIGGVDVCD